MTVKSYEAETIKIDEPETILGEVITRRCIIPYGGTESAADLPKIVVMVDGPMTNLPA